jgi:hypothetical protein
VHARDEDVSVVNNLAFNTKKAFKTSLATLCSSCFKPRNMRFMAWAEKISMYAVWAEVALL